METDPKPLSSTAELMRGYVMPRKTRKLQTRQELVCRICYELGIEKKYERGIFFTLLTDDELTREWKNALTFKANPAALFNKRVRALNREIKERLKNES